MISFRDLTETDRQYLFLIPEPLKPDVIDAIKEAGFSCESINWKALCKSRNPYDTKPKYKDAVEITRRNFEETGYKNTTCVGGIKTKLNPNDLFDKCLLFFGENIDPDYEQQQLEAEEESRKIYQECYKDWLKEGQIPVEADE